MWETDDARPIHLKEAEALYRTLQSIPDMISDKRVDVHVDNQALIKAWENGGGKDLALVEIIKDLVKYLSQLNCDLKLLYVKSADNPADAPSRRISDSDARLTLSSWTLVEAWFGPHSFDLMALDSNCMTDREGRLLPHYTPWPLPESSGVKVFSQHLTGKENYYVFPPFNMVGVILSFLLHDCPKPLSVSLVIPKQNPHRRGGH